MRVRPALGVLAVLLLWCSSPRAAVPEFRALYDDRDWFALRDAVVSTPGTPAFYRGVVALAFNDLEEAGRWLRKAAREPGEDAIEARTRLITAAQIAGDYRGALEAIRQLRPLVPDASGLAGGEALFAAMAALPRQQVARYEPGQVASATRNGNLFVPLSIEGRAATYIVDTGADVSVMSEGEARRLGLTLVDAPGAGASDAAGAAVPFRLASAERVSIGGVELAHVPFRVVRDDQQPFVDLPEGWRGVLGLPVLLALRSIGWDGDGRMSVGRPEGARKSRVPNLCLDGATPVLLGRFDGRPVRLFLDTGATTSRMMPRFAQEFPDVVSRAVRGESAVTGVAGTVTRASARVAGLQLSVDGLMLSLSGVDALLEDAPSAAANLHGWAGLDLFRGAGGVTIDFDSMRVLLRQSTEAR